MLGSNNILYREISTPRCSVETQAENRGELDCEDIQAEECKEIVDWRERRREKRRRSNRGGKMTSTAATGIGQVSLGEVELVDSKEHVGGLRTPSDHASVTVPTAAAFSDSLQALKASTGSEPTRSSSGHTISLRDVEEALQETREQRELRIRNMFDLFDTCKSGYVDHNQIKSGFKSLSIPLGNKYANDLLLVCDSNRDGKVDFDEFKKYMDLKELELYQMFQEIDVKHNGVLALEELRAALGGAGIEVKDESLTSFVDHIDLDRNGVISFSEWRDFLLMYPHEATLKNIYQYWEKLCLVDIGESAVIPEGISRHLHAYKYLIAGGVAGAISRTATAPLDRLKVLLQVQIEAPTKRGVIGGLTQMYQEGGVVAFFRGNGINILKVAPESAIKFYAFEIMKERVVGSDANGKMNDIGPAGRLLAGGTAGAIAQTVIYPMDLVKTRLQTFSCERGGKPPPLMTLSKDILLNEGPRAFYRGLVPSLLGMVPYAGIDLAAYETLKDFSHRYIGADTDPGPMIQLGCGTISGALGATCVYPLQLIRTRLQAQAMNSPNRYTGMTDVFTRTLKHEGIKGFYKGLLPNLLKVVPAASITYVVYEKMKKTLSIN